MLDKEGEVSRAIVVNSDECLAMLKDLAESRNENAVAEKMGQIEDLLKDELEAAWLDIKADFNLNKEPLFERIKVFFRLNK